MTVKELANNTISQWRNSYRAITQDTIDGINLENYKKLMADCVELKEDLDNVNITYDYSKVDDLYCLGYKEEYASIISQYKEELQKIKLEARAKREALNKPITDKWDADNKHYNMLMSIHHRLQRFKLIFKLYLLLTKTSLQPISKIDIGIIAKKTDKINAMYDRLNIVDRILKIDQLYLNIGVIIILISFITDILSILFLLVLIAVIALGIITFNSMRTNLDVVSFVLQDVSQPNREDYKEIDFSSEEFNEFERRQILISNKLKSNELKDIYEKSKGAGKETLEEEYKNMIDDYVIEYNEQVRLQGLLEQRLKVFIQEIKDNTKYIGSMYSMDWVLNYNLQIGKDETTGEPYMIDIRDKAIVIQNKDSDFKEKILQLLLLSLYSNIRFTNLQSIVFDSVWGLKAFAPIAFEPVSGSPLYLNMTLVDDFKQFCDAIRKAADSTSSLTRGIVSIDEYNEAAMQGKNMQAPYTIAVATFETQDKDSDVNSDDLKHLISYARNFGVIFVICCKEPSKVSLPIETIVFEE